MIELENNSDDTSIIKFYFTGGSYYKIDGFQTSDSLILTLKPHEIKTYNCGIGTWEINNSLDSLVAHVKKIEIETSKSTTYFNGNTQIHSFFKDRIVDDRYKARIRVNIE